MRRKRRDDGFALLLCLVLVLIAGIALAAAARQSATEALAAREATEALQRKWAVTSCRATLLPRADGILTQAQAILRDGDDRPLLGVQAPEPSAQLWVSCNLAGIAYDLVLTDEQAKYNPTQLGYVVGDGRVRASMKHLASAGRTQAKDEPTVLLRPMLAFDPDGKAVERIADMPPIAYYAGYGQLFDDAAPAQLLGSADRPGPAMRITCWGDGRINITRASDAVLKQALDPLMGAEGVAQFLQARRDHPGENLKGWMGRVTLAEPEGMTQVSTMLTQSSNCHGLWVVTRGKTRSWYAHSVRHDTPEDEKQTEPLPPGSADAPVLHAVADEAREETDEAPDPVRYYDHAW